MKFTIFGRPFLVYYYDLCIKSLSARRWRSRLERSPRKRSRVFNSTGKILEILGDIHHKLMSQRVTVCVVRERTLTAQGP